MGVYNHVHEDDRVATLEIVDSGFVDTTEEEPVDTDTEAAVGTIVVPLEILQLINSAPSGKDILNVCIDLAAFLAGKNAAYGDSALNPVRLFSKASAKEQLLVRMDDKINRMLKGNNYGDEDTLKDLLGYLLLYHVAVARDE